jgi:HEPN domain-containing protein
MKDRRDLTRGWLAKANSDLATASLVLEARGPYDTVCFHSQQAIEKALKAFLAYHGQAIPWTHDLEELQRLCLQTRPFPELEGFDLTLLTDYAVAMRYDFDFWPDKPTAADALEVAQEVWRLVLMDLPEDCHP